MFLHGVISELESVNTTGRALNTDSTMLLRYFDSLPQTLLSLFMAISSGVDWEELVRPLADLSGVWGVCFAFYVAFVVFGVLNVVTAVFVDSALQIAQGDRDLVVQGEMAQKESYMKELRALFYEADMDDSGSLSWDEFEDHLQDERVQAYLRTLDLDVTEARNLFDLIDIHGTTEVSIDDFVSGCMRLKGAAKSIDVCTILFESRKSMKALREFSQLAESHFRRLERSLDITASLPDVDVDDRARKSTDSKMWRGSQRGGGGGAQLGGQLGAWNSNWGLTPSRDRGDSRGSCPVTPSGKLSIPSMVEHRSSAPPVTTSLLMSSPSSPGSIMC
eukprot:gnl/TRDRNA2_/TRDRNA2_116284_c3_seq1.p1 gnl/TRDRNA2_/TRDRNA2_116284_c3~~gnl/TRDRNA2_/TRDRNA2_116284_c3_seq1.p1  ORF type:complete len:376 (+),score=66.78 gnl/TRDRNA2_/TRDRNA2_116284_c3_seq1:130-1128(+)